MPSDLQSVMTEGRAAAALVARDARHVYDGRAPMTHQHPAYVPDWVAQLFAVTAKRASDSLVLARSPWTRDVHGPIPPPSRTAGTSLRSVSSFLVSLGNGMNACDPPG